MTRGYKCDMCGEFNEGRPALDVDIDALGRVSGGGIVLGMGHSVPWSLEYAEAEFCVDCSKDVIRFIDGGIRHER